MDHLLSPDDLRALRLRAQRLAPRADRAAGVTSVLQQVVAVQAQEPAAAALALRARGAGFVEPDVEAARLRDRSIVRTWTLRGTLHLIASADLSWLLPLLGPIFIRSGRRRAAELGLDEDASVRGVRAIRDALAGTGPMTRSELAERLTAGGLPSHGQAAYHLVRRAALEGAVCFGPDRGHEPTYVLLDEWLDRDRTVSGDAASAELARRYVDAYGPTTPDDLAAWSGLSISRARASWQRVAGGLIEVQCEATRTPVWMTRRPALASREPRTAEPTVRLVPAYDTYLLGYRRRDFAVAAGGARHLHPGGGVLRPALLADGRVSGTWRTTRGRDGLTVAVEPFEPLAPGVGPGLEAEAADIGRFLGVDVALSVAPPR